MFPGKMPRMSTVYTFIVPFVCCALCDCRNGGVSTTAFKKKKLRHTSLRLQHIDARITTQLLYFIAGLMLLALSFGTSNNRTRLLQPPARSTNIYVVPSLLSHFSSFHFSHVSLDVRCPLLLLPLPHPHSLIVYRQPIVFGVGAGRKCQARWRSSERTGQEPAG